MGRSKTTNSDLPPRLFARKGKKSTTYYYVPTGSSRKWINLGKDKDEAFQEWANLEAGKNNTPLTFKEISAHYKNDIMCNKSIASQKDNLRELKQLLPVFGAMPLTDIEPHHIKKYLIKRTGKIRANREKALLSHIINYARSVGYVHISNPCVGIANNKETGRDRYVDDDEYKKLWDAANDILRDYLDLMLDGGQRVTDSLELTTADIRNEALWVTQNKTGAKLGIEIIGDFKIVIDRILVRLNKIRTDTTLNLICHKDGRKISRWTIRDWFNAARKKSGVNFQMRDLRAKNATDTEDIVLANKRLGHSTMAMTEKYIKNRKGKKVAPLK